MIQGNRKTQRKEARAQGRKDLSANRTTMSLFLKRPCVSATLRLCVEDTFTANLLAKFVMLLLGHGLLDFQFGEFGADAGSVRHELARAI